MTRLTSWLKSAGLSDVNQQLFPAMSRQSLIRHYLPLTGAISHSVLTVNLFAPSVILRLFPLYDRAVSNALLFQSHVGIGFFVFFRPHLYRLNNWNRVEFSVVASVLFNYGSLLLAIFVKSYLPKRSNVWTRVLFGLLLSAFSLSRARKYVRHIDSRTRPYRDVCF